MATRMQQRRGTFAQWDASNPILNIGEIGFESDTNKFKIGDGVNHWDDLPYFLDADSIGTSLDGYIPESLLGVANGVAQLNSSGKLVSDQIPNVDEITQDAINTALVAGTGLDKTYDDNGNTITLDIDSTVATKTYADDAVSTHSSDTTSVHGITDTAELATKTFAAELLTNATKTNVTITGDKNGLTITAENGVADSTTDNLTEGSTNKYFTDERAQDAVGNAVGTGLTYTDSTGAIAVDTTAIQARVANVSDTEIGYLNGVTSAIQDQLDDKAPLADPTFTGTATVNDLAIEGSLTFSGTATEISSTNTTIEDPLIYLADGNPGNINDLGFVANYNDGTYAHTGLVKDASEGAWKLFKGVTDEPTNTVNFAQGTLDDLKVAGLTASSITVGDVSNTEFSYLNGVTSAIQTQLDDKAEYPSQTGNDGKFLKTDGTAVSWQTADALPALTYTESLDNTSFSPDFIECNYEYSNNTIVFYAYDNTTANANLLNETFPIGSVITVSNGTDSFTFTLDGAFTRVNNFIFANATTTETSLYIAGTFTISATVSSSGKYLTNDGTSASWDTIPVTEAAAPTTLGTVYGLSHGVDFPEHTGVGYEALSLSGSNNSGNTAVGYAALRDSSVGFSNTAIGGRALREADGSGNTAIGYQSLYSLSSTGSDLNVAVGMETGLTFTQGSNNILIGSGADTSASNMSNEITLGNSNITRFRIPGLGIDINKNIELMQIMGAY